MFKAFKVIKNRDLNQNSSLSNHKRIDRYRNKVCLVKANINKFYKY